MSWDYSRTGAVRYSIVVETILQRESPQLSVKNIRARPTTVHTIVLNSCLSAPSHSAWGHTPSNTSTEPKQRACGPAGAWTDERKRHEDASSQPGHDPETRINTEDEEENYWQRGGGGRDSGKIEAIAPQTMLCDAEGEVDTPRCDVARHKSRKPGAALRRLCAILLQDACLGVWRRAIGKLNKRLSYPEARRGGLVVTC